MVYYYAFLRVGPLDNQDRFIIRSERELSWEDLQELVLKYLPEGLERLERQTALDYERYVEDKSKIGYDEYLALSLAYPEIEEVLEHVLDAIEQHEPGIERVRVRVGLSFYKDDELVIKTTGDHRPPRPGPKGWVEKVGQAARVWAKARPWAKCWELEAAKEA